MSLLSIEESQLIESSSFLLIAQIFAPYNYGLQCMIGTKLYACDSHFTYIYSRQNLLYYQTLTLFGYTVALFRIFVQLIQMEQYVFILAFNFYPNSVGTYVFYPYFLATGVLCWLYHVIVIGTYRKQIPSMDSHYSQFTIQVTV